VERGSPIQVESTRVAFDLVGGKHVKLPATYGAFHDPKGLVLPRCEIFFGPWKKTKTPAEMNRAQRRYFGGDHRAVLARLPSIPVEGWKPVGEVEMIYYVRRGVRRGAGGKGFHHPYKQHHPVLYKQGRLYRLSLGEHCLVDDRGYVYPVFIPFLFLSYVLSHLGWLFFC